jgi:nondiscriminating aspartyl-tRNA synthetase
MGFFESWHELMDIQEGCIKFIVSYLHQNSKDDLNALEGRIILCPEEVPFPRLTFREAQELFYKRTDIDERNEPDLSPAAERALSAWALEEHGTDCVFITDWKAEKRPFYAYPNQKDPSLTNTFDLLWAGTEITSGGQRRHSYESMIEGIRIKGMEPENFSDYLSIFKYGMPPHGGFGMGFERLTMTLLKLKNIREAALFPSDTKRLASNRIKAKIFFGSETVRNEIIRRLRDREFDFQHLTHEETPTASEGAAQMRGFPLREGIKALILRGKRSKKNYQFNISADLKLDMKACAEVVGEKCEFEDPVVILERFGVPVGGVPPFGNLLNLDNYVDEGIARQERAVFNCGLRTESIVMKTRDLFEVIDPKFGNFAKE